MRIGAIEAGGTKMVCAVVEENGNVLTRESIPTTMPDETTKRMIDFFSDKEIDCLGIASFGPVDLNINSKTYGHIMNTPKEGWSGFDMVGTFKKALSVPVGFDTDVNGAVYGEVMLGSAKGCNNAIYITVGTGIGVGVYCNGSLLHGLTHPEAGHMLIQRHPKDLFKGNCPFHQNCLEGFASGPALEKRWGKPAKEITDAFAWESEAYYLAQAIVNYILCYSPEKIILWGGVMHKDGLLELVRGNVKEMLGGYISHELAEGRIEDYIVSPGLLDDAGIVGAAMLGRFNAVT